MSYRPYLESGALRQMHGLPEQAFDMPVTLLARICDDPYDPVFSTPTGVPRRRVADVGDTGNPRPPQRVADMNPPSASRSEPRMSRENELEQNDRTARLDELLSRADQAAQSIAAQQAERHASSKYAARMELEAQTQAKAGQRAETRNEAELELLRRSRPRQSSSRRQCGGVVGRICDCCARFNDF